MRWTRQVERKKGKREKKCLNTGKSEEESRADVKSCLRNFSSVFTSFVVFVVGSNC